MSLQTKIHSFKQYIRYAYSSKTKYKVHSPFVFKFIEDVLESTNANEVSLPVKVINYYTKTEKEISIRDNAGEGSKSISTEKIGLKAFINKVSIPKKYGLILARLCEYYNIDEVIELGTSIGISAAYFANNKNILVRTVEANQSVSMKAAAVFKKLGINNVEFIHAKFDEVLEDLNKESKGKRIIFIDGDHNKESTLRYYKKCLASIKEDTILILDDIYWSEEMTEAWYDISRSKEVSLSIDLYRMGILFFRKEQLHQEHFRLWY